MRSLVVTEVASADLSKGKTPFSPNHTVVALNATAGSLVLQSSDTVGGTYATIATIAAGKSVDVVINKPFLKLSAAGSIVLLGN